jgi:hypothetical protein
LQDDEETRLSAYNFLVNDIRQLRDLYKEQVGQLFAHIAQMRDNFE